MKKIYSLLLLVVSTVTFAQTFYSENMGTTATSSSPYPLVTVYTGFQNSTPVVYTGTSSARASGTLSTGYNGASGASHIYMGVTTSVGQIFQIDGLNTSAHSTANIQLSFGYLKNALANPALVVEKSTDGSNWTALTFTDNANTSWNLVTIAGSQIPSVASLSLRFTNPSTASGQIRLDDVKLSDVNASCTLALGNASTLCDASTLGIDTYTVTIPFTGAGNATYVITPSSGTVGGDNPTTMAAGNITVSGVTEGSNFTATVVGGTCNTTTSANSPECKPVNPLPFSESFPYTVGNSLNGEQKWTAVNTGDNILVATGNLNYAGVTSTGNSITFTGTGAESRTLFTDTTTGTIYASFIATASDLANITTDLANTYFAVFTDATGASTNARVWIRKNGTQYQYGLGSGSAPTDWDATLYNANDIQYVVLGYDFTNTLKLFINPTVGGSAVPTIAVTPTAPYTSIGGFLFRQDTNTTTPTMIVDELRVTLTPNFTLGLQSNSIAGLNVYPNPVSNGKLYITSDSGADKTVAIYDILGKQVMATALTNDVVNVSALNAGVYIVKVTEAGNTATRKLVIR